MLQEWITMPDGSSIYEPDDVKYLGVFFDSKMTFKKHIDIVNCKINRMVGILWKSEHLTTETKKNIYNSLVESHLSYGIVVWGAHLARNITGVFEADHIPSNLKQLYYTQNKIIRAIVRKPKHDKQNNTYTSMSPIYKELKILKLYDLYYYNLALMAYSFFHGNDLPDKIAEKFTKKVDITEVRTRNNILELYYTTPRLTSTFKEPNIAAASFWNTLPLELKKLPSLQKFKTELKLYLVEKY